MGFACGEFDLLAGLLFVCLSVVMFLPHLGWKLDPDQLKAPTEAHPPATCLLAG